MFQFIKSETLFIFVFSTRGSVVKGWTFGPGSEMAGLFSFPYFIENWKLDSASHFHKTTKHTSARLRMEAIYEEICMMLSDIFVMFSLLDPWLDQRGNRGRLRLED